MVMINGRQGNGKRMALIVLALVIGVYALLNWVRPGGYMAHIIPSACWGLLALVALKASGFKRIRSWFNGQVTIVAALVAICYIFVLVDIGIFTGFGESVLSFAPRALFFNSILVISTLLGMEFSRAYLIKSFGRARPFLIMGLVTVLYAFVSISTFRFLGINDPQGLAKFLGIWFLPMLAESLLASYLALVGGPVASLAYRGPLMAFWWFCPILPHLSWGIEALLGVMVPAIGFLVINQFISPITLRRVGIPTGAKGFGRARKGSLPWGWLGVAIFGVLIVWASTGLLGFQPTTMISGSMSPSMDVGDVAIVQNVSPNSIESGDIIQYWLGEEMVIHRVIEVQQTGNEKVFVTKGDANQKSDPKPVLPAQVRGKVILTIPKVGWAVIYIKSFASSAWSFISSNVALVASMVLSGTCIFYLIRSNKKRSFRKWKGLGWGRGGLTNGKLVAPLASILIITAGCGFAYSHWSDSIYISGTVTTGTWGVEKTFILTVKHNVNLGDVTYYGAVKLDSLWQSVELTLDGYMPLCEDKIYTGTISGLSAGIYEWKMYYVDTLGENHLITSGTEELSGSVTNEYTLGPTSLCIRKTVRCGHAEHENGFIYRIEGKIKVWNLDWYPAIIVDVSDTIEYKLPGFWWESLTPISFTHNVPEIIPHGYHEYTYTCRFSTENIFGSGGYGPLCKPAWRNLIEITISNHPWGMHTFHHRISFELEE